LCLTTNAENSRVGLGRDRCRIVVITVCGSGSAGLDQGKTTTGHGVCELGVVVDRIVVCLDAVAVVDREF